MPIRLLFCGNSQHYWKSGALDHERTQANAEHRGYAFNPDNYKQYYMMDFTTGIPGPASDEDMERMRQLARQVSERYEAEQAKIDETTARLRQKQAAAGSAPPKEELYGEMRNKAIEAAEPLVEGVSTDDRQSLLQELVADYKNQKNVM
ncbi:hypothetical protein KL86DPRO_10287 [uncultured delta proteobacterium]|uniref:Uncharacterized protein n=1 Tax=uncultured delta proteobacterium TaxID=34034 RepID=A0A212IXW4_9DELT|nr:hypothetical protein KL86DPRO_10287 [uncultured delta proteobacterium]